MNVVWSKELASDSFLIPYMRMEQIRKLLPKKRTTYEALRWLDILRIKYADLIATEASIWTRLRKATLHPQPQMEVLVWLENVVRVKKLMISFERLLEKKTTRCFFSGRPRQKHTKIVIELTKEIDQLQETGHFENGLFVVDKIIATEQSPSRSLLYASPKLVGNSIQWTLEKIWDYMIDPKAHVICIYGAWCVGKTTTMMKISNQLATSGTFDTIIWVTVSKDLDMYKWQSDISLQINLDLRMHQSVSQRAVMLHDRLQKSRNFLLIFDNLKNRVPLETVGIPRPSSSNGSKVVLITRKFEVGCSMNSDRYVKVEALSWEEKWTLFVSKAGNMVLSLKIQPFARQVVKVFPGLPFVIVSIGHAMRDEANIEVWKNTLEYLISRGMQSVGAAVFNILKVSYNRLKHENVKSCFLYCALFPSNYMFKPEELVRYWMAESFIAEGDIISRVDEGYDILGHLLDVGMLEMSMRSGDDWIILSELSRDLAMKIIEEEGWFWSTTAGHDDSDFRIRQYSWEWTKARKASLIKMRVYILDILPSTFSIATTLLLHDNPISRIVSSSFSHMLALKFLDLSYCWITELPPSVSHLTQLRVLFLHYCMNLISIPSPIKMKELRVLSLCGTSITKLPEGMEGLICLRSLDLSETRNLGNIRAGTISSLFHLEELRMQGSGLCTLDATMVEKYLLEMACLKHLAILTVSIVGYEDHLDTIMRLQGQNLKIFSINMYGSIEDYTDSQA